MSPHQTAEEDVELGLLSAGMPESCYTPEAKEAIIAVVHEAERAAYGYGLTDAAGIAHGVAAEYAEVGNDYGDAAALECESAIRRAAGGEK